MLSLLNVLHAMAARRGEGLHPALAARLEQSARSSQEQAATVPRPQGSRVVQVDLGVMLFRRGRDRGAE